MSPILTTTGATTGVEGLVGVEHPLTRLSPRAREAATASTRAVRMAEPYRLRRDDHPESDGIVRIRAEQGDLRRPDAERHDLGLEPAAGQAPSLDHREDVEIGDLRR